MVSWDSHRDGCTKILTKLSSSTGSSLGQAVRSASMRALPGFSQVTARKIFRDSPEGASLMILGDSYKGPCVKILIKVLWRPLEEGLVGIQEGSVEYLEDVLLRGFHASSCRVRSGASCFNIFEYVLQGPILWGWFSSRPWYQDLVEVLNPVWGLFVFKFWHGSGIGRARCAQRALPTNSYS